MERNKKQPDKDTPNEVAGYDQGKEVEFAGDSGESLEEQIKPEHEQTQSNEGN